MVPISRSSSNTKNDPGNSENGSDNALLNVSPPTQHSKRGMLNDVGHVFVYVTANLDHSRSPKNSGSGE